MKHRAAAGLMTCWLIGLPTAPAAAGDEDQQTLCPTYHAPCNSDTDCMADCPCYNLTGCGLHEGLPFKVCQYEPRCSPCESCAGDGPLAGVCVECTADSQCAAGDMPGACDPLTHTCSQRGCHSSADCDDCNACTADLCGPSGTCVYWPLCTGCSTDIECDDGDPCNAAETCDLRTAQCRSSEVLDCNANGCDDAADIADGTSGDCQANGVPDECDLAAGWSFDCDLDGLPDECSIAAGAEPAAGAYDLTITSGAKHPFRGPLLLHVWPAERPGPGSDVARMGPGPSAAPVARTARITIACVEITDGPGGPDVPVTLDYELNRSGQWRAVDCGRNLNGRDAEMPLNLTIDISDLHPAGEIRFRARGVTSDSPHVFAFGDGEPFVPPGNAGWPAPYGDQLGIGCCVAPMVSGGTVQLPDGHQVLLGMELGTISPAHPAYDLQDLVLMLRIDETGGVVDDCTELEPSH